MATEDGLRATVAALRGAGIDGDTIVREPRATVVPDAIRLEAAGALERISELAASSDKIELRETLGEGGMGVVRLGRQLALDRDVAVKTLRPEQRTKLATIKLLREAWVTGALEHPNVVPVHDIVIAGDGTPQIVLKRIEGVDWASTMHDARALHDRFGVDDPLEWNLRTLMQVCNAVHFAHSRGVLHRDLKPENVMLGGFGEVYVVDWGIAVALEDDGSGRLPLASEAKEMAGTPCYMAPEMLGGRLSVCTDVYLLGAILHEIVSGHPPHQGATFMAIVAQIMESAPSLPDHAPPELARIVHRAMDPDPDARFESPEQMRLALQTFLQHRHASRLTQRAEEKLALLEAMLEQRRSAPSEDRNPMYHLFGECRFGFRQALEVWPDNEAACERLERATCVMVELELRENDPDAAHRLLAELRTPPLELGERVEQARAQKRTDDAALRNLRHDLDPSRGRRTRWALGLALGIGWTALPFTAHVTHSRGLSGELSQRQGMVSTSILLSILVGLAAWKRGPMMSTAINRRFVFGAVLALATQLALLIGDSIRGLAMLETLRHEFIIWFLVTMLLSITADRRLAFSAAGYLIGFFTLAFAPNVPFLVIGCCNSLLLANLAVIWRRPRDAGEAIRAGWRQ